MVDKLVKRFIDRFPPIPETGAERVTTYFGVERVYLQLIDEAFLNKEEKGLNTPVLESNGIKRIAERIFNDVEFRFYHGKVDCGLDDEDVVFFSPEWSRIKKIQDYKERYGGQSIEVLQGNHRWPFITFNLANRGTSFLSDKQRDKYYNFALCLNHSLLGLSNTK
jgi:hypothetical protein